ncbi:MAG TPA: quinolinate phosphoribosyl transferase [Thermoleophilia bacterium]|nr:quinolinate phosphoribosyl transferase [Thermoleophilia bacterium]HQG54087.1 quinolinate phosphoribosyl transferase [Thermoleophilia bacterium]
MPRERLSPEVFSLPVEQLRRGYYSDAYFNAAKTVLEKDGLHRRVVMQVFQKRARAVLGGMDEALAVLRLAAGRFVGEDPDAEWRPGWDDLVVKALYDGDEVGAYETVLTIEGDYALFAHLETVYLGVLTRRTLVSTNVREVVEAAGGKTVFFFPARFDHYRVQTGDGYAAHIAGAIGVSTDAQASWWGGKGIGTIPHGLIAACGGDTVEATRRYADHFYPDVNVVALVDFDNDCVRTSVACADALGERLWGVRLDTSETMVDRCLWGKMGTFKPTGVVPELVWEVRRALDAAGHGQVKIVVSGGFDAAKIAAFEAAGVPVDAYGVGSSLLRGNTDFTADVVMVEGRPCAKVGRKFLPNPRLERIW